MATTFKNFQPGDITNTRKLFYEAIPITGSILSGTYLSGTTETNIKNYSHGMFQSVYDYPYLSSSANKIFDLSAGFAPTSALSSSSSIQNSKKINMYNNFAQNLAGFDTTGSIRLFDQDGDYNAGGTKLNECFFIPFTRLLSKDEIKKESFQISVYRSGSNASMSKLETLSDYGAATNYFVNSPAGEYGLLFSSSAASATGSNALGIVYYQAGIVVLTASVFQQTFGMASVTSSWTASVGAALQSASIQDLANGCRHRISAISFNNCTELNSTILTLRASSNEYNYSSNPTALSGSKIIVKNNNPLSEPVSFITRGSIYSENNECLASFSLSEPLKKTPSSGDISIRVRLDF